MNQLALHSTMLLLYRTLFTSFSSLWLTLHSTMLLLYLYSLYVSGLPGILYIPLCFYYIILLISRMLRIISLHVVPQNKVPVSCTKTANYNSILTNTSLPLCRKKRRSFFLVHFIDFRYSYLCNPRKKRERTTPTTARSFSHP